MADFSNDRINSRSNATTSHVANVKAKAHLTRDNDPSCEGQFTTSGDPRLSAGSNFNLTGFERFDGKYRVDQVTHRINRMSGYTTEVRFTKIDNVAIK